MSKLSTRTTRTAALATLAFAVLAGTSTAQSFVAQSRCGEAGSIVHQQSFAGGLARKKVDQQICLLSPAFTGAGNLWTLDYSMTRTQDGWPWWDAYARIDVLSADGQSLGRSLSTHFKGSTTGTLVFYGENYEEARPHRVRITFSQPITFDFSFDCRLTVRPVLGANPGGPDRENPLFMQIGTAEAPNFSTGDMVLTREFHRFMLFWLAAGQELRAKLFPGATGAGGYASFDFTVWDANQRLLASSSQMVRSGTSADTRLYRNAGAAGRFVVLGLATHFGLRGQRIGFFSPQGASPRDGESVTAPSAAQLNPFGASARAVQTQDVAAGATASFAIPASGEWTRLRLRVQKPVLLSPAPGVFAEIAVFSLTGALLARDALATDPWGHEPSEYLFERDDASTPATTAATIAIKTRYEVSTVTLDWERRARVR